MAYIELNGKKYDARTGKIINNNVTTKVEPVKKSLASTSNATIKPIDGFSRRSEHVKVKIPTVSTVTPKPKLDINRAVASNAKRKIHKSATLMRPAVKKPKIVTSGVRNDVQRPRVSQKVSAPSPYRLSKATDVKMSPMVSKFGGVASRGAIKKSAVHMPVASAPKYVSAKAKTAARSNANELQKFEEALRNANSHLHKLEKDIKKSKLLNRVGFKNKAANITTMVTAFVLLGGFFAYQNATQVSLKLAANKSGVAAKMPSYTPAGFSADRRVESVSGKVAVSFRSNSDSRNYTLTQSASNWNSAALLDEFVSKESCSTCFQTWSDNGKTIYTYDNSNATWVDSGIWYRIEGDSNLTQDQLQRIASSL